MGKRLNPDQFRMDSMFLNSDWVAPTELPDLTRFETIALDTETKDNGLAAGMGPSWYKRSCDERGHVCGVSVAWGSDGIYVPIEHPNTPGCFSRETVARWLRSTFMSDTLMVFQNAPYDIGWLNADLGLPPPKRIADTTAAAVMVDENRLSYSLDNLCKWRGLPGKDESLLEEAVQAYGFGKKNPQEYIWKLPARFVGPYAAQDPVATLDVWNQLLPIMQEESTLRAFRVEMDLIPLVHEMRRRGVLVNVDTAKRTQADLYAKRDQLLIELADKLEIDRCLVNMEEIRKTSVKAKWHDAHGVAYPRTDPTEGHEDGQPSFKKDWMRVHPHWLPQLVNKIIQTHDAAEKFIGKYILDFAYDHGSGEYRLHPTINQFRSSDDEGNTSGTRSHRFSYANPPLQQAPARDEDLCVAFRGCFEPEKGQIWGSKDFSQQEFKWIVNYAYMNKLPKADLAWQKYQDDPDTDFHIYVGELTGLDRPKDASFAKCYGARPPKFALMTGMTLEQAIYVLGKYDAELPFIQGLSDKCKEIASNRGYLIMKDGARAHFNLWEPRWIPLDIKKAAYKDPIWQKQMFACSEEEAKRRFSVPNHPWTADGVDRRLVRAMTHKAMNRLIQGVAARQTKMAMVACWREGIVPLLQMHDELNISCETETNGQRVAEIMREALPMSIPMKVDQEYGITWGRAKKFKNKDKVVVYGATWQEAVEERTKLMREAA